MSEESSKETTRSLLIAWAKRQDKWVQRLVDSVAATRSFPSQSELGDIYSALLAEKQLSTFTTAVDVAAVLTEQTDTAAFPFTITELCHLGGVNRLIANQKIEFNKRFTVIYGENGVGKTGYVRILKRLAGVRSAEDVLPNVMSNAHVSGERAAMKYDAGTGSAEIKWSDESNVAPFNRMAIFDSRSLSYHIDSELTFHYIPKELSLLKIVHDGIEAIRTLLEKDRQTRDRKGNVFLPHFTRGTKAYVAIETLGASTDLDQLRAICDSSDSSALDTIARQISALESGNIESELRVATDDNDAWAKLVNLFSRVAALNLPSLLALHKKIEDLKARSATLVEEMFLQQEIPGAKSKAWEGFIRSANSYIVEHLGEEYPGTDCNCIYCLQPLNAASVKLIALYRSYVQGEVRKELTAAESDLAQKLTIVNQEDLVLLRSWLSKRAADSSYQHSIKDLKSVLNTLDVLESLDSASKEKMWADLEAAIANASDLLPTLRSRADESKKSLTALSGTSADQKTHLVPLKAQLAEMKDAAELRRQITEVSSFVAETKWVDRVDKVLSGFRALSRSLTELSKSASDEVIRKDFEKHFQEESAALRCPAVVLTFPGRKGETARHKSVCDSHPIADVLSDGEQKVIALADFLAEVSVSEHNTPLIFDDPITSLDYKRMEHVVSRLFLLSQSRQVIVFTHNIWFTVELMQKFQDYPKEFRFIELREDVDGKGFVSQQTSPRVDHWDEMKKSITEVIAAAKKTQPGVVQDALIKQGYSMLRSLCELAVEEKLLRGVVRRFAPNIALTKLSKINATGIQLVQDHVSPIFERCCRRLEGHSQTLETQNIRASLTDLENDWSQLQDTVSKL